MHFFTIPATNPMAAAQELNAFCAEHRVVSIERRFVDAGTDSFWSVCVTVVAGRGTLPEEVAVGGRRVSRERVDYKEVLSEADFAVFADFAPLAQGSGER